MDSHDILEPKQWTHHNTLVARLSRELQRKSFDTVKVRPRFEVPGVREIDPDAIMLEFADGRQHFGEYDELLRRIEAADSEAALQASFDVTET